MNWKAGDIGILLPAVEEPGMAGIEVAVTSSAYTDSEGKEVVSVEPFKSINNSNEFGQVETAYLRKKPGYDGNEDNCYQKTKWKDCVWKPSELVTL